MPATIILGRRQSVERPQIDQYGWILYTVSMVLLKVRSSQKEERQQAD